jgi:outer membrane protein TolC
MKSSIILFFAFLVQISLRAQDSLFTSKQAIDLALQQNLEIQIAQSDADIAHINNNWGNAGGLPTITANLSNTEAVSNINQKLSNGNTTARNNVNNNNLNSNIGVSWRFFNGMKVRATKERFDALEKMSEINFKQQVDQIILQVLNTYFNILRLNKQVIATKAIIDLSKERLKIAETRFNVGSGSKTDMLQAKIDLNSQEANLLEIERQIITSTAIINSLIKRAPDAPFKVTENQFTIPTINYKDLSEKVESQNHALLLAQKERSNLVIDRQIITAQRIPTATLSSTTVLSRTKASAGLFLVNQSFGPNVGLSIGIPIFNGNINKTQLKVNSVLQKQKDIEIELLKEDLRRDLHIAYQDFLTAIKDAEMEGVNVKYAEENNFISTERFKKLQSNSIELRQAQLSLSDAQNRYINAQYRAQIAANSLKFIAGEISKN